jgi:hypothetical protein
LLAPDARQLPLAGMLPTREEPADAPPPPTETVAAYHRRTRYSTVPRGKRKGAYALLRPCRSRRSFSQLLKSRRWRPTPMK